MKPMFPTDDDILEMFGMPPQKNKSMLNNQTEVEKLQQLLDNCYLKIQDLQDTIDYIANERHMAEYVACTFKNDGDYAKNQLIQANDNLRIATEHFNSKSIEINAKLIASERLVERLNSTINSQEFKSDRKVKAAEDEQKRLQNNCNHANDIISSQAETIKLANQKLTELKNSEEFLAKKLIKLHADYTAVCQELHSLRINNNNNNNNDSTNLKQENENLKNEISKLKLENSTQSENYTKYITFVQGIKTKCNNFNEAALNDKPKHVFALLEFILTTVKNSFSK